MQKLCRESNAAAKESDAEPARAHAGPRIGCQVLRRALERPTCLPQRPEKLTQGLLGLTQGQRETERG